MAENKGVNNAQNAQLNQSDDAIHAHAQHDTFGVGTVDAPAIAPGNQMWFGTGNTPDNYNITNDVADGIQTAMKVHVRQGADIAPTKAGAWTRRRTNGLTRLIHRGSSAAATTSSHQRVRRLK
jgi:hypothetical protein